METPEILISHLKKIISTLTTNKIPHTLAGGLAYSALVEPRATMDIDILVLLQEKTLKEVFKKIEKEFDAFIVHKEPMQMSTVKIWRAVGVIDGNEIIIDLLLAESEFHKTTIERSFSVNFFDIEINIVTLEDLILLKKQAGRKQDLVDIENIYTLLSDSLDNEYLEMWDKKLGLT